MYYDNYRGKKGRKDRREHQGCGAFLGSCLLRLIAFILIIVILAVGILYLLPVSFLNVRSDDTELSLTKGLPAEYVNILLIGLDAEKEGGQRCDCIMVASVSMTSLKITSLQRDTEVTIPGYSGVHKLNSAYSYGGAELTMRVVNETFGLNITDYIAVDFEAMVKLVDAVGGIDLEVQENELKWYNVYAYRTYRSLCNINEAKYINYLTASDEVTTPGMQHMDGIHATGYCRIRYADSDYGRTNRQRKVLVAILDKIKSKIYDPRMYASLYRLYSENVRTSLSFPGLIAIGEKIVGACFMGNVAVYRVPQDEYINDNGSTIEIKDLSGVKNGLFNFIYGS